MKEFTFKLTADAKEYPSRFGGNEVVLNLPENLAEVRTRIADGVDQDAAIYGLCVGQGLRLTIQKRVKDVLGAEKTTLDGKEQATKDVDVPTMLAHAVREANAVKIGAPRAVGTSGKSSKAVAAAEAKAETATSALRDTYLSLPAAMRKTVRKDLLTRGVFTEEQLTEMDAAAK